MTPPEIISLVASIASLVLAVIAIWLSIAFFRMSSDLSARATKSAEDIASSVIKLETLFDRLYADTFSMMKDTVSDMRRHIWPEDTQISSNLDEEVEKKATDKVTELKAKIDSDISTILERQKFNDGQLMTLKTKMTEIIDRGIQESRNVETEALSESIRIRILSFPGRRIVMDYLIKYCGDQFPVMMVVSEVRKMRNEGLLSFPGSLTPETVVTKTKPALMQIKSLGIETKSTD